MAGPDRGRAGALRSLVDRLPEVSAGRLTGSRNASRRRERGSATAELAAALPALALLLFAGLTAVGATTAKAQCVDAARDAALAAARGESGAAAGARSAPPGAVVTVSVDGDTVTATVRAPVRALGGHLPRLEVTATAVAAVEPSLDRALP